MTQMDDEFDDFADRDTDVSLDDALIVNLDGFEGPLDLLLALSRTKKIDLKALSIAALVDQYLLYIEDLQRHRLEIAADYLVMAAWLTYLKSKLLMPSDEEEAGGPSGDELAARLAFRLKRLDAMRAAAKTLFDRPQLGDGFYACGAVPGFAVETEHSYKADQFALLKAYASCRLRPVEPGYQVQKREVWSIKKARACLQAMLGFPVEWAPIQDLVAQFLGTDKMQKTTIASTFGASLELARDGEIELRQEGPFQPLYVKVARPKGGRDE